MKSDQRRRKLEELRKKAEEMHADLQGRISLDKVELIDVIQLGLEAAADGDLLRKELVAEAEEVERLESELAPEGLNLIGSSQMNKKKMAIVMGVGFVFGWLGVALWMEGQARKQGTRWISYGRDKPMFAP